MSLATAFFGVWPYIALTIFLVGHFWRWRYDQFGWTTRTSELMEKRWLMWGSPIFHVGVLLVVLGHALGLLVPPSATAALGLSEHGYHMMALSAGLVAGAVLVVGFVILLVRRFVTKARFRIVTRRADILMYVLVAVAAAAGLSATLGLGISTGAYDYRSTVSVWFRSVFAFNPNVDLMASAPWIFQVHAVAAFALIAVWPFTRLVHLWSIPLGYLVRPPIVYHTPAR
ncbi:MAG: respiratory nitrate reductase subunit gamma [Propionibacteriaceae bacterium]|nr:respiratory nitrate reductase subunit gamma [Propionibacteriaceae bacterium]